ncbi:hypothetical protein VNO80_04744 [Phaseolus coccineus]|uniref:Uncharacterized protein n=1 Tax=Phaseolus coccineus TaxID=3886 RepID=A0AAN9NUR7_PHACN
MELRREDRGAVRRVRRVRRGKAEGHASLEGSMWHRLRYNYKSILPYYRIISFLLQQQQPPENTAFLSTKNTSFNFNLNPNLNLNYSFLLLSSLVLLHTLFPSTFPVASSPYLIFRWM